ncbi:ribonuclease H-like domain-containing protein [Paraphysoderma sedebokerense]|nr:ribonuclease H-like domain-containing protein [Paraphysoderma sedebokerense]
MSTVYKVCDRCQKLFVVRADLKPHHYSECEYHWGRSYVSSENGEKQQIYSCCSLVYGSPGCEVGPHVWKETSMTELHKSIPFIETPDSNSSAKFPVGKHKVIALDCEMCYTTAGFELSRLSVLDSTGDVILDELVKPSQFAKIVDLNTKYSGIISLEDAEFSLEEIREKLLQMIDRDTIIIGQSLENDFKLIHPTVIDTSLLFPHPKGPPHRYSLKHLSRRYLQIFIQASEHGHDSAEDARSCIDLVRLKIEKGAIIFLVPSSATSY